MKSCNTLISSVQLAIKSFSGAYGLGIISSKYPDQIIAARKGLTSCNWYWKEWKLYCFRSDGTFICN